MSRSVVLLSLIALTGCPANPEPMGVGGGAGGGGGTGGGTVGPISGQTGAPCTRNSDCNSGLCLASGVCTETCTVATSCPQTWRCDAVPNAGTLCVCEKSSETSETCDGKDNNCDGRVDENATCSDGLECNGGRCMCPAAKSCGIADAGMCPDLDSDPNNCGACGNKCGSNQACQNGSCTTSCQSPPTNCGGSCVNTSTNNAHCGQCNRVCSGGKMCDFGTCDCPGSLQDCNGTCTDTTSSATSCGACNRACGTNQACMNSQCVCSGNTIMCGSSCVDPQTSNTHCGVCNRACGAGSSCIGGTCTQNCPTGQTRCGGTCTDTKTDRTNCGGCGTTCPGTQTCQNGTCAAPPVNPGAACTADSDCGTGGSCRAAGSGWPGGYCTYGASNLGCPTSCPTGSVCNINAFSPFLLPNQGYQWVCMKHCTSSSECRSGYVCNTTGGSAKGVCVPDCETSADICRPYTCDTFTGFCNLSCFSNQGCAPTNFCSTQDQACYCSGSSGSVCSSNSVCNSLSGLCGCKDDTFCATGRHCDINSGECR